MRTKIKLVSTAKKENGISTGCFYTTAVNKKNMDGKLKLKKYDWVVRKHVMFEEDKIK